MARGRRQAARERRRRAQRSAVAARTETVRSQAQPVGPVLPQAGHLPSAAAAASLEARDRALGAVRELVEAQQRAQAALIEQVALARRHGANWVEIGQALGVTRQAARQRFGRRLVDATDGSASDGVTPHS